MMIRTMTIVMLGAMLAAGCANRQPAETADAAEERADPRHCMRDTGTRLPPAEGRCSTDAGRVYTKEDLERHGGATTEDQLRSVRP